MEVVAKIDLDDLWSGDEWGTTVGQILTDELRSVIKAELRKSIKSDKDFTKLIEKLREQAITEALKAVA
jgi:hypothetical protein